MIEFFRCVPLSYAQCFFCFNPLFFHVFPVDFASWQFFPQTPLVERATCRSRTMLAPGSATLQKWCWMGNGHNLVQNVSNGVMETKNNTIWDIHKTSLQGHPQNLLWLLFFVFALRLGIIRENLVIAFQGSGDLGTIDGGIHVSILGSAMLPCRRPLLTSYLDL